MKVERICKRKEGVKRRLSPLKGKEEEKGHRVLGTGWEAASEFDQSGRKRKKEMSKRHFRRRSR